MLIFGFVAIVAVVVFVSRQSQRQQQLRAFQLLLAHDDEVAPLVSRSGPARRALQTRPPLRDATLLDGGGGKQWLLSTTTTARVDVASALAGTQAMATLQALGGKVEVWMDGPVLQARVSGWRPASPAELKARLVSFVAVADALERTAL